MWYVYIIRSINFPEQEYVGATADLRRRLPEHNAGKSAHTAKFKPWQLVWYCAFPDKLKALEFEKYLKSHSGRAFAKKRLSGAATKPMAPSVGCEYRPAQTTAVCPPRYSPNAALSLSRSATSSFFIADNSEIEQAEAARMPSGTALAVSFMA